MISLYQDLMISFWRCYIWLKRIKLIEQDKFNSEWTLKYLTNKDMHSMADFFNEAAEKYLKEKEAGVKDQ